jgi:hypothetical protein
MEKGDTINNNRIKLDENNNDNNDKNNDSCCLDFV